MPMFLNDVSAKHIEVWCSCSKRLIKGVAAWKDTLIHARGHQPSFVHGEHNTPDGMYELGRRNKLVSSPAHTFNQSRFFRPKAHSWVLKPPLEIVSSGSNGFDV